MHYRDNAVKFEVPLTSIVENLFKIKGKYLTEIFTFTF